MTIHRRKYVATINLTALPGNHEQVPGRPYKETVIELLGTFLSRIRVEAKTVAQITALVKAFGDDVAKAHPDTSFMVSVSVAKGSRKPNGFDQANRRDGLGQETWMRTVVSLDSSCVSRGADA
jgi:hypothetical protein